MSFSRSRICDGRRTNRGDNTVGSAVWRLARTADGNQKSRIFIIGIFSIYFTHIESTKKIYGYLTHKLYIIKGHLVNEMPLFIYSVIVNLLIVTLPF